MRKFLKWLGIAFIILVAIGALADGNDNDVEDSNSDSVAENNNKTETNEIDITEFEGDMSLRVDGENIVVTINTNVPDGGIFEVSVLNGHLDFESEFLPVEGGKIEKTFHVSEWEPSYVSGTGMFRFDIEEHKQPSHIVEIYGEKGENLKGEKVSEGHDNYMFGNLQAEAIPYPDEATLSKIQNEALLNAFNSLIESSDGVILGIQPRFEDNDWQAIAVTVSDAWYYSAEFEKERFAEQVGQAIQNITYSSGIVPKDEFIMVYFYDSFQKELATPKILGGYKIKN